MHLNRASLVAQLVKNACNARDPSLIPGPGRSTGEGLGYPLHYSWASLVEICWRRDRLPTPLFLGFSVAQLVKNLPIIQETWLQSLVWEDPLEQGTATHSSIFWPGKFHGLCSP